MRSSLQQAARRITFVLFGAQALGSAGFIASATIASIVGAELSGRTALAGLPSATFLLGAALAALMWGVLMEVWGRRASLGTGLVLGVVGAALASLAVVRGAFPLLLVGLALMGTAHAALQLGRFVAAEVNPPEKRGRAVGNVVLGGTVGAVAGPLMVGPVGRWAQGIDLPELAGPYLASMATFALAALLIALALRPDPKALAAKLEQQATSQAQPPPAARSLAQIFRRPGVIAAVTTMVLAQMVMTMLMVITALHMVGHHHSLAGVSVVISAHTLGMFAFSVVTGQLADHWGRLPVVLSGSVLLILSCLAAPLSPQLLPLSVALFGLGLGWNLCFVGGSALLSDQLTAAERARTQGVNDLLIGLASAAGSLGSGVVFAAVGFGAMSGFGAALSFVPLLLGLWWGWRVRQAKPSPL
jgi:MFS family permease